MVATMSAGVTPSERRLAPGRRGRAILRRAVLDRIVDADDARLAGELLAHELRDLVPPRLVGTVDLGDDRREHRRPRRDLDDLHLGVEAGARSFSSSGRTAFAISWLCAVALVLVDEVDLQIAVLGQLPQVVLPHEAVEVDRRRGAGVALVVGDLGHRRDVRAHRAQHGGGALDRRSGGHVDDDLELGLVVERQHLEDDQLHATRATSTPGSRRRCRSTGSAGCACPCAGRGTA